MKGEDVVGIIMVGVTREAAAVEAPSRTKSLLQQTPRLKPMQPLWPPQTSHQILADEDRGGHEADSNVGEVPPLFAARLEGVDEHLEDA
jgi:hypothetical protein